MRGKPYGQLLQPPEDEAATPAQSIGAHRESEVGKASQKREDRDLPLQTRQRGAEAIVDSEAEGQVPVGLTRKIEQIGFVELALVAVGGSDDRVDQRPAGYGDPGDQKILARVALRGRLKRAAVP